MISRSEKWRGSTKMLFIGACLVLLLPGCGENGTKTYPVNGRVEVAGGDVKLLAGHMVELIHTQDPSVRASGVIDDSGRFQVQSLEQGKVLSGAREGSYSVRLLLSDEGDGRPKPKVPKKYLDAKTSGWTLTVPAKGELSLTVEPK